MNFVDRYALAVTAANRNIYLQQAAAFAAVFKEHGASSVVECWSDDVPEGKLTSLPTAVQRKAGETVVFLSISWPNAPRAALA